MSAAVPSTGTGGRIGELALWTVAALIIVTVHVAAAAYMLQAPPDVPSEDLPPAAIMIELAAEPEAANTEEEQITQDITDQKLVEAPQDEPVKDPPPEPVEPEPMVEETPPELPEPELPEPEMAESLIEPPPIEPIEPIDPLQQQMEAMLENVEVPLPIARPPPPTKKIDKPKPEPKKKIVRKKRKQQQARREAAKAKAQVKQSNRTAARQSSAGALFSSTSPAKWKSRVQAKIARYVRRCPGNNKGNATVRFRFNGSGNITGVSLLRSSGDSAIDNYIVSAVQRASTIPAPPPGAPSHLDQPLSCR